MAAQFGFRGGLVPGVTVFGYMASRVARELSLEWLERGSMQVRFQQPFYDGDEVVLRVSDDGGFLNVSAEQADGNVCATARASLKQEPLWENDPPESPLPDPNERRKAVKESFIPGQPLGTLRVVLDLTNTDFLESQGFDTQAEPSAVYRGADGVAHPAVLLGLCNRIFIHNFVLGPWIHAGSELVNFGVARHADQMMVTGRIQDCFERKGHEFVVLDLTISTGGRRIQRVRHTAIYRPKSSPGI